jgi:hypothetical protein
MTFFYLFIHAIYLINYIYIYIYIYIYMHKKNYLNLGLLNYKNKLRKLAYIIILQEIKYLTVIKRGWHNQL